VILSPSRIEHPVLDSSALRDNPLGDPYIRQVTVYLPQGYDDFADRRYPTVYLLASHGNTGISLSPKIASAL